MKSTTRSILVDPISNTITEIEIPRDKVDFIHEVIGCERCSQVYFGNKMNLSVDDVGLINIPREPLPPFNVRQGFFVIHADGQARNLIAGKGILWAYDHEGITVDLPPWITPAFIAKFIKFVPLDQRNAAAGLCREIMAGGESEGIVIHLGAPRKRYIEIVKRALGLCRI